MTTSKIQMDQIRSTSATVTGENIRAGSQKKSSLSPAEGLQGASPDATCTCPSGDGSLVHPCPAHPASIEQAGGDERVIGWRERILAAHPNSDPGFWPDALLVEHMAAEIADLRAALARVAELEHVLRVVVNAADHGSWPTTVMHGIEKVREVLAGSAPPIKAQPEETPGEILAAKLIETWVAKHGKPAPWSKIVEITALATSMPNDERDRLLALDDDVDAQAQHSVPEEFSFEYRHPNGECHTVTVSREQVINEMPDFLFEALCSKLCNCEPVGETNVVECRCDEYAEEFKLIAAAPGNEGV
ncbi:hypothetical protein QOV23_28280 [Pseudomonas aeruginosa]